MESSVILNKIRKFGLTNVEFSLAAASAIMEHDVTLGGQKRRMVVSGFKEDLNT